MERQTMSYEEARNYLNKAAKKGIVLGLSVISELLDKLGKPQEGLRIVHIAGTNGKGSILSYLEQIFLVSGYHTGRYVSPAIGGYENRFLIDGKPVSKEWICEFVAEIREAVDLMEKEGHPLPTVFEIETAMAFLCFRKAKSEVVLLETGMGGRLDATNVIEKPLLSIIGSVSMDHMAALGPDLTSIAKEKAGIIKEGCDTLLYPKNPPEVENVIRQEAGLKKSHLYEIPMDSVRIREEGTEGSIFSYRHYPKLSIQLPGEHQIYNAAVAVEAIQILKKWFCISEFQVEEGLRRTRWSARLEKISDKPLIYLDGAHNKDGAKALARFLKEHFQGKKILAVMGVLADKEYDKIAAQVLPMAAETAVITPDNPRALQSSVLKETAMQYCSHVTDAGTPKEGLAWLKQEAHPEDVGIVFGSLSFMDQLGTKAKMA